MPESVKKTIGGINYRIQEWLATERDEFLFELNDMFGTNFSVILENYFADTPELDKMSVVALCRSILIQGKGTPKEKAELIKRVILASVKGPKEASLLDSYDMHWTKHYAARPELLWAILELNFGSMIQGLKKKLQSSGIYTQMSSVEPEPLPELKETQKKPSMGVNFLNGQ